jgi:DnaJ-domain-containing protein 1
MYVGILDFYGFHVVASVASRSISSLDFTFHNFHITHSFTLYSQTRIHPTLLEYKAKMEEDPINNFFTAKEVEDPKILYTTLAITSTATSEEIRKAYRKLALKYHPDKHTTKNGTEKEELGKEFQRVGFAYAVLSDEAKRKRYVYPTS